MSKLLGGSTLGGQDFRVNTIAFLGGLSLFLSTIEYLFPKPVPFFRLGLANLPILMSLGVLRPGELALLALLKVLGQGLINGTLASYVFLFSLGGTAASVLAMYGAYRILPQHISYIGISLIGALASNLVQVGLSLTFIFGNSAWVIVPFFLGMGTGTGFVMGWFAQVFANRSAWFRSFVVQMGGDVEGLPAWGKAIQMPVGLETENEPPLTVKQEGIQPIKKDSRAHGIRVVLRRFVQNHIDPRLLFIAGILTLPAFIAQDEILIRVIQVVILMVLTLSTGKRLRFTYFFMLLISITMFNLLQPSGRILFEFLGLRITLGALESGAFKALTLIGFVFLSLTMVQPHLILPGTIGRLLTRLFAYFEAINHHRRRLHGGGIIKNLDAILFRSFEKVEFNASGVGLESGDEVTIWPKQPWFVWGVQILIPVTFWILAIV